MVKTSLKQQELDIKHIAGDLQADRPLEVACK